MIRETIGTTTRLLAIPQGFTLTLSGELTMDVSRDGVSSAWSIWLYVLGASAAFVLLALVAKAHHGDSAAATPSGGAVLNVVAVAVVPLCYGSTNWITSPPYAYLVSGFLAVTLYVCGYCGVALALTARSRA